MDELRQRVQNEATCPICTELLSEPLMTECGHSYCEECWDSFRGYTTGTNCPLCRTTLTRPAIRNKALCDVLRVVFPDRSTTVSPAKRDFTHFVLNIYRAISRKKKFPFGYRQYLDTTLSTYAPNDITLCGCGLVALDRTVRKNGPNQGRPFSSCPLAREGCGHFHWQDEPAS